ncbi:MAG: alpha-hydroxy-acid oxidizing protein [Deltaproteobacteria bacterium]|nr:alpha-hydroxy-acid oxidizing protein [Deltaproteobacteria bacterium]
MKWICTVCSYVHEGDAPPETCPVCGVGADKFVPAGGEEAARPEGELTLEAVRDAARQKLQGICAVYPWCDGKPENICNREAYGKAILLGGVGSGTSFRNNVTSLERQRFVTRVCGEHFEVDAGCEFFGKALSMPVMGASTSGVSSYGVIGEEEFCAANARGCVAAGTLSWRGDTHLYPETGHWGLKAVSEAGGGVQIFKPREQDVLKGLIGEAEKAGCDAVGVDLDGCGSTNFARAGKPVYRKSVKDLKELVGCTALPFIAKGVMCVEDARMCVEAGVKLVAVSNHGGRVLDCVPGVADVLAEIAQAVGSDVKISADGGVRTGYDVLKMLALGADYVLVGRDLIRAAIGGGEAGVRLQMERLGTVLKRAMLMTGCRDVGSIGPQILGTGSLPTTP